MADLAKALGRFLMRDVAYILAGLYVLSALGTFGDSRFSNLGNVSADTAKLIILLGSAYIVGFAIKELFAFTHLIIEAHYFEPGWLEKLLYLLHQRKAWEQPKTFNHNRAYAMVAKAGTDVQSRYDRISDVIHMLSSVGSALIVCAPILFYHGTSYAWIALTLGAYLIAMSRFQSMRRMLFLSDYREKSVAE